jgi:hypothetical protein
VATQLCTSFHHHDDDSDGDLIVKETYSLFATIMIMMENCFNRQCAAEGQKQSGRITDGR